MSSASGRSRPAPQSEDVEPGAPSLPTSEPAGNLQVTYRPIGELAPYARNSRTHSDAQIEQICASMREFGWTNPILIDDSGTVIAGHGRLLAAQKLGIASVPTIELAGLSEEQRRALVIADNKLALNAGWDEQLLSAELGDLDLAGFDLGILGFGEEEVARLFASSTEGLTDPDEIPAVPSEPVTVLGDIWILGKHRIACGDSTDADVVAKALNGVEPHLMVTDPPYGVEYDPEWRVRAKRSDGKQLSSGRVATGEVLNDDRADWREAWALFPGDVAYIWHGALHASTVAESLVACGFNIRSQIIWSKPRLTIGRGDYHWQHEPCWYAVRKGKTGHWAGDRKQATIWAIDKNDGANPNREKATEHGTQKPVECMRRPIENNSSPGQADR